LAPELVRQADAEVHCQLGLIRMARSRWAALACVLRALVCCPTHAQAWHGLVSLPVPESGRRLIRRLLGRPEWNSRRLALPLREAS
jgi:hypothetical protein